MMQVTEKYDVGVIHGRFQILHNDHVKYIMSGKKYCRHMIIGITNPDPFLTRKEKADPARHHPASNPLTYYERSLMINIAFRDMELKADDFSVVPFPISYPDRYQYYVPLNAVYFLSIYDDWGRRKLEYFESLGLKTHVLRDVPIEEKGISAHEVRNRILKNKSWKHLVPPGVAGLIESWNIQDRMKKDELK